MLGINHVPATNVPDIYGYFILTFVSSMGSKPSASVPINAIYLYLIVYHTIA